MGVENRLGRPTITDEVLDTGIYIRLSKTQKDALLLYMYQLNKYRNYNNLDKLGLSNWARDIILNASGNFDLATGILNNFVDNERDD
jgi:hypothetical protein